MDLQRQAEKDRSLLSQRLKALEREMEEQETKGLETEQHLKTHTEDLNQRVQALEKQLKHDRQFIEVWRLHQCGCSIQVTQFLNVICPLFCRSRPLNVNMREMSSSRRSVGWKLNSDRQLVWIAKDTR